MATRRADNPVACVGEQGDEPILAAMNDVYLDRFGAEHDGRPTSCSAEARGEAHARSTSSDWTLLDNTSPSLRSSTHPIPPFAMAHGSASASSSQSPSSAFSMFHASMISDLSASGYGSGDLSLDFSQSLHLESGADPGNQDGTADGEASEISRPRSEAGPAASQPGRHRCILESESHTPPSSTQVGGRVLSSDAMIAGELVRLRCELEQERALRRDAERRQSQWKRRLEDFSPASDVLCSEMAAALGEELRISFTSFTIGDVGLFLITPGDAYLAFNVGAPRHFVAPECTRIDDAQFTEYYILGRIVDIKRRIAGPLGDRDRNPFGLPEAAEFSLVYLEGISRDIDALGEACRASGPRS